jgi:hypothetical protein
MWGIVQVEFDSHSFGLPRRQITISPLISYPRENLISCVVSVDSPNDEPARAALLSALSPHIVRAPQPGDTRTPT